MLKPFFLFIILLLTIHSFSQRVPLTADFKNSASYRWLNKKVLDSRMLDDMENMNHWQSFTSSGVEVVDARKVIKTTDSSSSVALLSLNKQTVHEGTQSLQMITPVRLSGPAPKNGRGWGRSGVRREFGGEDWTKYNRISIWIYPNLPGFYTTALDCRLYNDGKIKLPLVFGQEGETSLVLRNHEWNHVVWEIGNVARDKITAFEMSYGLSGNMREESDTIQFYFDDFTLEKVQEDKIEGWDVWKDRIAYSQAGYQTGATKTAIANGIDAKDFQLMNEDNGAVVLSKKIENITSHLGSFQVMDFSEMRAPGSYVLKVGNVSTPSFKIDADVYEESLEKALNFFYAERCGFDVPGVHSVCHQDWTCKHGDKSMIINGGWHDAGDLTQGLENTSEIDYALFSLAEKMQQRTEQNQKLYAKILDEAKWGLQWILKTSFGDGYRNTGSISSRRTDNILGNDDDVVTNAGNNPMSNFEAAMVEAIAYRVLKNDDERLAAYALKEAEQDWRFAVAGMATVKPSKEIWRGSFDSDGVEDELASEAIIASIELWKATRNALYQNKATSLASVITNSQQRKRPNWDIPLTGFFYTDTTKERILHYCHRGREQAPTLALAMLCDAFPNDENWMKWYSCVTLYSEYLKTVATYTAPYNVMPASVYVDTEYIHVPESRKESFRQQVLTGVPLGKGHYLRLFPVWMDYRGHFGTILPQAQALANAAHLRGDLSSIQLSEHQLEWIIGKNPFAQSAMYGEGHDYVPLYTPSSGDIVGALPVGIQTRGEADAPYWPVQNTWTYKEIWVHPVTNYIWLLKDVEGAAMIEGNAKDSVVFTETSTKQNVVVMTDKTGHFRTSLPEGNYTIGSEGKEQTMTLLPGSSYQIECRPDHLLSYEITKKTTSKGDITLHIRVQGNGAHHFNIRTDNLLASSNQKDIVLKENEAASFDWKANISSVNEPWVAVIVPDDDLSQRKELRGAAWEK